MADELDNCYAINLTDETHDQSFAMTSSFSNMYLAAYLCFNLDKLSEKTTVINDICSSVERFLNSGYDVAKRIVDEYNFERIVYLGSNTLKGISQESSLKMLELTAGKTVAVFDTPLGFRHGPKSIINESTLTVVYVSDDKHTYKYELDLIKEISNQRKNNKLVIVSTFAQTLSVLKSLSIGLTPDNPCPSGEVNRVVKGVTLYPYTCI